MKKRSRFLQVPIEPFTVDPEVKADELLEKMERISFQGRSLGVAHRVWQKMLADDVTIFMGMAGALSAGGLRMVVAYLIEHRYIDCLVSTGANLYHDLHETRGRTITSAPHVSMTRRSPTIASTASTTPTPAKRNSATTTCGLAISSPRSNSGPIRRVSFSIVLAAHLWKETQQNGILTAALSRGRADFLPGDCGFVDRHGPVARAPQEAAAPATSTSSATSSSRQTS